MRNNDRLQSSNSSQQGSDIPWAKKVFDIQSGLKATLKGLNIDADVDPYLNNIVEKLQFNNEQSMLWTNLHIGRASAACVGAFAVLLESINQSRGGRRSKSINVDIRHAELITSSLFFSSINGSGYLKRTLRPSTYWLHRKMGVMKGLAFCRVNKTADGRWLHTHGGFNADPLQSVLQSTARKKSITKQVAKHNGFELEQAIADAGGIAAVHRTPQEWAEHPHGKQLMNVPVIELTKIADGAPQAFSYQAEGKPLAGINILDMTRVLAGPASTRLLSGYGADVLKVTGPHLPYIEFFSQLENSGKRSASLDLRDKQQFEKFNQLTSNSDVFVSSYQPGALEKLACGPEDLARKNPRGMVYVSISCYGSGPWEQRGGFETLAQAATGYADVHSQILDSEAPSFLPMSAPNDYLTAYKAAIGALAGLRARAIHGGSYHVKVSLAQTAMWTMAFGTRALPEKTQSFWDKFKPALLSTGPSTILVSNYLETIPSHFGDIRSFSSPIQFEGTNVVRQYPYPSVPFGTHAAEW